MFTYVVRAPFTHNKRRFARGEAITDTALIAELENSPHAHSLIRTFHPKPAEEAPAAEEAKSEEAPAAEHQA